MKTITCPECGGNVQRRRRRGRTARHHTMRLDIPESIAIAECEKCGELYIDAKTARAIDTALARSYRTALQELARSAIESLVAHVEQKELEQLLGVSHGYLSHLRAGRKSPSPELVAHLGALAKAPARRVAELRAYWKEHERSVGRPRAA